MPRTTSNESTLVYTSSTIAGTPGTSGYGGDGSAATAALLANPLAVTVDSHGNYYISDYQNNRVREVLASTGAIVEVAGTGTPGFSGDGGSATSAQFSLAHSLAVDAAGNLYIADAPNGRIRIVNPAGIISTFAGNGSHGDAGDGGQAVNATLYSPAGVAVDSHGNVFIADYGNGTVREVSAATGIIKTVAGIDVVGFGNFPGDGGPAVEATLGMPYSVAVDETGNIFIGDIGSSSIREVYAANGIIGTIASNVSTSSLATDSAGNLYFANYDNSTINKLPPGGAVVTIGGTGINGFSGDGGPAIQAQYNQPYGIALGSSGDIYVGDYSNDVIRLLTPVVAPNVIVANGASDLGAGSPVAPGEIISLFGTDVGFTVQATAQPNGNGVYGTQFANTTVTFNGIPAPIFSSGPLYVSAAVPYELSGATKASIVVEYLGKTTATATVPVATSSPGIFTYSSSGLLGGAPILNVDGTVNTGGNAAAEKSNITIFVTGEGQTSPPGVDGLVSAGPTFPQPLLPVTVTIGGNPATVVSAMEASGMVAGVLQIVATLPAAVTTSSAVPVTVQVGSNVSPAVNIAVQ